MAAPAYNLARDYFAYTSDNTTVYTVATNDDNGVTVNAATPTAPNANPTYPRGWRPRHIQGAYLDGGSNIVYRTRVPIFNPANTLWTGATNTFTKGGVSWVVEGRIGERRVYKGG